MLIHSVTPAHLLTEQPPYPRPTHRMVGNDVLEGVETPQGFQISRVHSTDPAAYLNVSYSPGSFYKK